MPSASVRMSIALVIVILLRLSATNRRNHARRRRRLQRLRMLVDQFMTGEPTTYCAIHHNMPILRLWFDVETELRQDFRLTRRAMHSLQRLLHREQDHGWGNELEVLIYTYWLAHGLSYRVVARVFNVPKATVHDIIHRVAQNIWDNLRRAIDFPQTVDLPAVGQGIVNISGTPAFYNVVGAIDGSHILANRSQHTKEEVLAWISSGYTDILAI
ncbi:uncharacterized protein LOC120561922 [Perca fluviatilis]|uniref:uncharacterized protein LOC120561922 n=1 Tax=Perca fluviatilis TaxID=8168 RepID=UPI0019667EDD|nr:uncharacterized protein LOC120561922 [Perca fluviatilis]